MSNKLVKDYLGNLIPKDKARKILGKYYVEGESCFLMEDGQWYRKTSTDKILYDHYTKKYVLKSSSGLLNGIVTSDGETGFFSENNLIVTSKDRKSSSGTLVFLNDKVAEDMGYVESIYDGFFYKKSLLTDKDTNDWFNKKNIPGHERSKDYNLESNPEKKKELEKSYSDLDIKISTSSRKLAKFIGDYSFGLEVEVINGHIPTRIRHKYGLKALKDGSLKHDGGEGIEIVSMPMSGAKGIEVIKAFCTELSKRCEVNNYCSVHFHFGNVRKDKLYTLALYKIALLLQDELVKYFPYSRFNSIKADGKVYCQRLNNLNIDYNSILKCKGEEDFSHSVVAEFDKIYRWLNNGKGLAEQHGKPEIVRETLTVGRKKMFCDKMFKNIYSTKTVYHAITGNKWDRPQRYMWLNLLNLYFSPIGTAEFRPHEASTNSTKILIWMLICASILKYAEDVKRTFLITSLTLEDVLLENLGSEYTEYIMSYLKLRNQTFFTTTGRYRENFKEIEAKWFKEDPNFKFITEKMEIK